MSDLAPDTGSAGASARTITQDLMARLQRHYIKPGQPLPGGVFVPEVGENGGWGSGRRCDAIYVGFTSTSGRLLIGHEVKASRTDWLTELSNLSKADTWADQCHEWWLVTVPGVVKDGELPAGWGLMLPGTSKTRMSIHTRAERHTSRRPSWDAVRSIIARQDTLRAQAIEQGALKARADNEAEIARRVDQTLEYRIRDLPDSAELKSRLDRIETALGGHLVHDEGHPYWYGDDQFTEHDLADVAALLGQHRTLERAAQSLIGRYATMEISQLRRSLDTLDAALAAAALSLPARADVPA